MAQIYVQLNQDGKSIENVSTAQQDGYILATIDPSQMDGLLSWPHLCWLDENKLVRADNLPLTQEQTELNAIKADINTKVQQANDTIAQLTVAQAQFDNTASDLTTKVAEANTANSQADTKIKSLSDMIAALTAELAAAK